MSQTEQEKNKIQNSLYDSVNKLKNPLSITMKKRLTSEQFPHTDKINGVCWNTNKKFKHQLIAVDSSGLMNIWDPISGKVIDSIKASKSTWLTSVDVEKQEGKLVSIGTLDNKILIFEINKESKKGIDPEAKKPRSQLLGHTGAIQSVQFLNNQYMIAGSTDSMVSLWDLNNPQRHQSMHYAHTSDVLCLSLFSQDPNIFLSGSSDLTAKIWDIRVRNPVQHTFRGHESAVNTVKFMPLKEPTTFATGSDDSCIRIFDLRMNDTLAVFQDQTNFDGVYSICFSQTGRFIFAGTENSQLKIFDTLGDPKSPQLVQIYQQDEQDGLLKCLDISMDGFSLAISGNKKGDLFFLY